MRNNNGPRIEPCGTPQTIEFHEEQAPITTTRCCLPFKYVVIQFRAGPLMPVFSIFFNKISCSMVSKAFFKIKKETDSFYILAVQSYFFD